MFAKKNEKPKKDSNFIKVKILLDSKNHFKGVDTGDEVYSISDWNKKYE
jgi:hypothetical protein